MPVTQTVAEKILREIVTRLEAYNADGKQFSVYRETMHPDRMTPTDYQVIVKAISNTRLAEMDRIGNPPAIAYQLAVGLYGQLGISEADTEAIEGHAMEIAGRMVRAIVGPNDADWYTMGGNAINTTIGDVLVNGAEAAATGQVNLLVTYRVREPDPFTASA